jgi:hypothetical protein
MSYNKVNIAILTHIAFTFKFLFMPHTECAVDNNFC